MLFVAVFAVSAAMIVAILCYQSLFVLLRLAVLLVAVRFFSLLLVVICCFQLFLFLADISCYESKNVRLDCQVHTQSLI